MEVSIRSYLTAGMAAVVGATAIGLAPALPAPTLRAAELPVSTIAEIALTGTSIPWETIASVVQAISSGGSLQAGVASLISSIGSEFAKEALPVITAAAGDVVKFVGTALAELLSGPDAPQIDFAAIIATATAAIAAGNVAGAVQALTSALSAPLTQISQVLFTPEFQAFVMGKVGGVLGALPEILRAAVETVVGIDIKPVIDALSGLLSGLLPAASIVAAPRALAAATETATLTATIPAVLDVPAVESVAPEAAAPPVAPADDASAKAPATESDAAAPASEAASVVESEAAVEAVPVDAAPETTPAAEIVDVTPAVEVTTVVPEETAAPVSIAEAPAAADSTDAAPAPVTRPSKPSLRGHRAAAKSADSGARAGRG